MRKTKKSDLYTIFDPTDVSHDSNDEYLIDGGFLIHRRVWSKGKKFCEIAELYVQYTNRHFGPNCHVVFDGYKKKHLKMCGTFSAISETCAKLVVNELAEVTVLQNLFLSNENNKSELIELLCEKFNGRGVRTSVADGDADVLIVQTAIKRARDSERKVLGMENISDHCHRLCCIPGHAERRIIVH